MGVTNIVAFEENSQPEPINSVLLNVYGKSKFYNDVDMTGKKLKCGTLECDNYTPTDISCNHLSVGHADMQTYSIDATDGIKCGKYDPKSTEKVKGSTTNLIRYVNVCGGMSGETPMVAGENLLTVNGGSTFNAPVVISDVWSNTSICLSCNKQVRICNMYKQQDDQVVPWYVAARLLDVYGDVWLDSNVNVTKSFICGNYDPTTHTGSASILRGQITIASSGTEDGKTFYPLPNDVLLNVYGASMFYAKVDAQNSPVKCGYMGINADPDRTYALTVNGPMKLGMMKNATNNDLMGHYRIYNNTNEITDPSTGKTTSIIVPTPDETLLQVYGSAAFDGNINAAKYTISAQDLSLTGKADLVCLNISLMLMP